MTKVKSLADLKAMREKLQANLDIREKAENPESLVQIKVAMATCGIAAGAKQVMEHMMQKADELGIAAVFTRRVAWATATLNRPWKSAFLARILSYSATSTTTAQTRF